MEATKTITTEDTREAVHSLQVNAVPLIASAQSRKTKVFWAFILLLLISGFLWSGLLQLIDYSDYPIVTTITVSPQPSLAMPKVLVCPFDFIKQPDFDRLPILTIQSQFVDEPQYESMNHSDLRIPFDQYHRKLMEMSYEPKEIFRICKFGGERINCEKNLKKVVLSQAGVCYSFVTGRHQVNPREGLKLYLHVKSLESFKMYPFDGISVQIHPLFPPFSPAVLVDVGQYVKIDLELKLNKIVSKSGQLCIDVDNQERARPGMEEDYYSAEICHQECRSSITRKYCNCVSFLHADKVKDENKKLDVCTFPKLSQCYNESIWAEIAECSSKCVQLCEKWDVLAQENSISLKYEEEFLKSKLQETAGNLIVLDIAYKRLEIQRIEQSFSFTFGTLISNVGGLAGWWLGASIMTMLQLFVLCGSRARRFACCALPQRTNDVALSVA